MRLLLQVITLLLLLSNASYGQYRPHQSQYLLNNYLLNPAITGIEHYADLQLGYREQWTGLEGAPRTLHLTVHTPLGQHLSKGLNKITSQSQTYRNTYRAAKPHHGLGGQIMVDEIGPFTRSEVSLSYAYHLPLSSTVQLSGGLQAGWGQYRLHRERVTLSDPVDAAIDEGKYRQGQPMMAVGLWAYSAKAYVGLSVQQLLGDQPLGMESNTAPLHGYLTAAYRYEVSPAWSLQPSGLLRVRAGALLSVDLGLRALWAERVWVGGAYRSSKEWIALAGVHISPLLSLGYAYDGAGGYVGAYSSGSHELVLNVRIFNQGKVLCPQYLW